MKHQIVVLFFLFIQLKGQTQPYTSENGHTRHRFAQLNIGLDTRLFSEAGTATYVKNSLGEIEKHNIDNSIESRILIGGTHFWGHVDFCLGIPIAHSKSSPYYTGVETAVKIFPWRIEHKKLRPYLGFTWLPIFFKQDNGTTYNRFKFPITAGFTYAKKNHLIELSSGFNYNNRAEYNFSETEKKNILLPKLWIGLGYKFMIETTLSAEKNWQNGYTKKLTDTLASLGRLNGFTLGIGPSAAFFLKSSAYNTETAPYANQHKGSKVFPEFGLGYYLHKHDVQINLSYRYIKSELQAYNFAQNANRKALTFEIMKFLADYHGFAVFAGPAISYERLSVNENLGSQSRQIINEMWRPGITLGWDIRPNRLQSWYLRTNLRYFPGLALDMPDGKKISFDQLEFNFIQFVIFPGRIFGR